MDANKCPTTCTDEDLMRQFDLSDHKDLMEIGDWTQKLLYRLHMAELALKQTETFREWAHNHTTICQSLRNCTRFGDVEAHIHECWEFGKALKAWRQVAGKAS